MELTGRGRSGAGRAAIGDWADDAGLPTIDVAAAFEDSGDPDALLADEINPIAGGVAAVGGDGGEGAGVGQARRSRRYWP